MLDAVARRVLAPPLDRAAEVLDRRGVSPTVVTGAGFVAGIGACGSAATQHWGLALTLWLLNRLLDGLDGPVARRRGATDVGGFLDLVSDFTIYGGFVVAVAVAVPDARLACLALLGAYYVSGTAFLALSSILERRTRRGHDADVANDGRTLRFIGGLAEGTETIVVYALICLLPAHAAVIAWIFAGLVVITAIQRIAFGARVLTQRQPSYAVQPD